MQRDSRVIVRKIVDRDEVFDAIKSKFGGAKSMTRDGNALVIKGIHVSGFGAGYCSSSLRVDVEPKSDKIILLGTTTIQPNTSFWLLGVIGLSMVLCGAGLILAPIAYSSGKGKLIKQIEDKLNEAARELE